MPYYLPPIGEDLRLTIVSTDDDATGKDAAAANNGGDQSCGENDTADDHPLDLISAMFAALRACWLPPPQDEARHGMEYTIRFAFKRDGAIVARRG